MVAITANLVKELREKTGAGMMDCKKALVENQGDFQLAIDWLRKKGHAAAAKRSDRTAAEGLVALKVKDNRATMIELNSETDFVARNEKFQDLLLGILEVSVSCNSLEELENAKYPGADRSVKDEIIECTSIIGEKIILGRMQSISVENGVIVPYVHNAVIPNAGKIAVLVAIESSFGDIEKLSSLGKQIAMHIAAARPDALNIDEVDPEALDREKQIFVEQARESGKPDNVIDKMIQGRIKKYYQEVVLLEQTFVIDNKTKISDVLSSFAKDNDTDIAIKGFIRYELGESKS